MREYSKITSLTKNKRGIYSLDTSFGCSSGMANEKGGCYGDCYAAKSAKLYGYDFSKTVIRNFENEKHRRKTVVQISKIPMGFVRIGTNGDPSEDWNNTMDVLRKIKSCNKEIVIITRHWNVLSYDQLTELSYMNVCINTSVSALDNEPLRTKCFNEYNRIKAFCKSVLRIVSCDFNLNNESGLTMSKIQDELFKNDNTIDTVLRLNKNNALIKDGVVNVSRVKFLGKNAIVSKRNKKTFFGKCNSCLEMCGLNKSDGNTRFENKQGIITQSALFV